MSAASPASAGSSPAGGRSLRIALDVREATQGASGDRTYWQGLFAHLFELAPQHRWLLCGLPGGAPADLPDRAEYRGFATRPGWLWTPLAWPRLLRAEQIDVAHAQYLVPPYSPCPSVVTIHDVSFLTHPEWFPPRALRIMRRLIPLSARRASRIICGSAHAAREIVACCGVPVAKVEVIPYAAAPHFAPVPEAAAVAARYGLRDYVLAVGLLQPRKNLPRLLAAFAQLAPSHPGLALALVGRTGWQAEQLTAEVARLGLGGRVVFCGPAPAADLPALYSAARLLVYPSLYEGFGLPPLEAMACGTPVACSNTSSLPEVVGEAGLLFDPLDVEAIAAAMARILDDESLAAELREAGPARAATFSWRRCAAAHLEVYQAVAASAARS